MLRREGRRERDKKKLKGQGRCAKRANVQLSLLLRTAVKLHVTAFHL